MANEVYANNREISCKAGVGKSICAFPDTCFTPPENPATPPGVPIPYPNTGMDSDATEGSKTVKISGKEVMLKNKSYFKQSTGDEAGCAAKKGVITSVNRGKVYFESWSMDVKFENENVVRHLDLTTHNHASTPPNTPTWPFTDRMAMAVAVEKDCKDEIKAVKDNCTVKNGKVVCPCAEEVKAVKKAKSMPKGDAKSTALRTAFNSYASCMNGNKCEKAARCMLSKKDPSSCCPPQTPHHIVPGSQFKDQNGKALFPGGRKTPRKKYSYNGAPCVCAEGNNQTQGTHGALHFQTKTATRNSFSLGTKKQFTGKERWSCSKAESVGAEAVEKEFRQCKKGCIEAQVRKQHQDMGIGPNDQIRPTDPGPNEHPMTSPSVF